VAISELVLDIELELDTELVDAISEEVVVLLLDVLVPQANRARDVTVNKAKNFILEYIRIPPFL
jgi:hypothetical protein